MLTVKVNVCTRAAEAEGQAALPAVAITFLEAGLTDNMPTAREAELWGGLARLTEADIAEYGDRHGVQGKEGPAGSRQLRQVLG